MILEKVFSQLKKKDETAFIPFLTMGFPNINKMHDLMMAAQAGGADILEIGIPFSDPIADGPTIQRTSEVALGNGMTLRLAIEIVQDSRRKGLTIPIVLMGYANPFYQFGSEKLALALNKANIAGIIVPDLPPTHSEILTLPLAEQGIDTIFFVSPTTSEKRMYTILENTCGFVYYVSTRGVTGENKDRKYEDIKQHITKIKQVSRLPVCIGFGVSTTSQVEEISQFGDGVIMASKLLNDLSKSHPDSMVQDFKENVRKFKKFTKKIGNT